MVAVTYHVAVMQPLLDSCFGHLSLSGDEMDCHQGEHGERSDGKMLGKGGREDAHLMLMLEGGYVFLISLMF